MSDGVLKKFCTDSTVETCSAQPDILSLISAPRCEPLTEYDRDSWESITRLDIPNDASAFTDDSCNDMVEGHYTLAAVNGALFIKGDYVQWLAARGVRAQVASKGAIGEIDWWGDEVVLQCVVYCALSSARNHMEATQLESALFMINGASPRNVVAEAIDVNITVSGGRFIIRKSRSNYFNIASLHIMTDGKRFLVNGEGNVFKGQFALRGVMPSYYRKMFLVRPTNGDIDHLKKCLNEALSQDLNESERHTIAMINDVINNPAAIPDWLGCMLL